MKRIILNIPHSTPCKDFSAWTDPEKVNAEHDKWVDWYTDTIFGTLSNNNKKRVDVVVFDRSRYEVDVERLINDPMENVGQGIIYTGLRDGCNCKRHVSVKDSLELTRAYVSHWEKVANLCHGDGILIDCHSFPSDYMDAPNASGSPVDVCIGFNDDNTNPGSSTISYIKEQFERKNYTVGLNVPFSNSFAPVDSFPSVMIEIRKGIYMNEDTRKLLSGAYKLNHLLNEIYAALLA